MDYEQIRFERREHIGILSLNRPDKMNSLTPTMFRELIDCFTQLRKSLNTRVVVVRGEGTAFCAGMDLRAFTAGLPQPEHLGAVQAAYHGMPQLGADVVLSMRQAPQPLIAAIRGPAVGGGFNIALACDARIAGQSARMNAAYVRIGFSAGDMAATYFLPRLIGFSRAAEYLYTGRFIDAATADRLGLVSRVVPDEELDGAAIALAEEMLQVSPFGLRLTKELLDYSAGASTLEGAIQMENRSQTLCMLTEDAKEGPRAFLEKRKPAWGDR